MRAQPIVARWIPWLLLLILIGTPVAAGEAAAAMEPAKLRGVDPLPPPEYAPIDRRIQGQTYWEQPPAVLSAYDGTWFDYRAILWHSPAPEQAEQDIFFSRIRELNFTGGMAYSQKAPDAWTRAGFPYYRTNLCNQLYLRNKSLKDKTAKLKKERTPALLHREPSLEDPAMLAAELALARSGAALDKASQEKVLGYDLRDEASYTSSAVPIEFDFSPVSLTGFRAWLKTQYADLEALNRQWETQFADWEAVLPMTVNELFQREYKNKKDLSAVNLAPCLDHRAYNDYLWFRTLTTYKAEIDRQLAGAPVGISGTQMPSCWGGFNYDLYGRLLTWCEYYDICGSREVLRGLTQEDMPLCSATPYDNTTHSALRQWASLLHGDQGCLVWPYDDQAPPESRFRLLDLRQKTQPITAAGKILQANFAELRCGIAPLLNRARFQHDGIAILYHQPSIQADWFFEVKRDGASWVNRASSWESSHNYMAAQRVGLHKLLEDCGLQYTYCRGEDLIKGRLLGAGIRVLILTRNVCLSDGEIAGLQKFVEAGGVVVADLMPGRLDNHGTVRTGPAAAAVEALFGLQRAPFAWEEELKEEKDAGYGDGYGTPFKLTCSQPIAGLAATAARILRGFHEPGLQTAPGATAHATWTPVQPAAGAAPATGGGAALIVKTHGRGKAITLNFDWPNYPVDRNLPPAAGAVAELQTLWSALLRETAGVQPRVELRDTAGNYPASVETIHYADGDNHIFAFINNREVRIDWATLQDTAAAGQADFPPRPVTLKLPTTMVAFDVLNRKDLGVGTEFKGVVPAFRPWIVALRPYRVGELSVASSGQLDAAGTLDLKVTLSAVAGAKIGNHVAHVALLDRDGNPAPAGVLNLPLPGGRYEGRIDLSRVDVALHPRPWKLALHDVTGGAAMTIEVKPKE